MANGAPTSSTALAMATTGVITAVLVCFLGHHTGERLETGAD